MPVSKNMQLYYANVQPINYLKHHPVLYRDVFSWWLRNQKGETLKSLCTLISEKTNYSWWDDDQHATLAIWHRLFWANDRTVLPLLSAMDVCAPALLNTSAWRWFSDQLTMMIVNVTKNNRDCDDIIQNNRKQYFNKSINATSKFWRSYPIWYIIAKTPPPAATLCHVSLNMPRLKSVSARSICFFSTASTKAVLPTCDLWSSGRSAVFKPNPATKIVWGCGVALTLTFNSKSFSTSKVFWQKYVKVSKFYTSLIFSLLRNLLESPLSAHTMLMWAT